MAARRVETAVLLAAMSAACSGVIGDPTSPARPTDLPQVSASPSPRPTASPSPSATPEPSTSPEPSTPPEPTPPARPTPVTFECDPARAATTPSPLVRLSNAQLKNTLRDLFQGALDPLAVASAPIAALPPDDAGSRFRAMDTRVSERHVQAIYDIADAIATSVTDDDAQLRAVAGACALQAAPTAACVNGFLDGFAARAHRRPLSTETRMRLAALRDGVRDGRELFRALIFSVLMAPELHYHVELDGQDAGGDTFELDAYSLAARLSYLFWQSMPDAELTAAARDGSILTPEGYSTQLTRIFEDPRTHATVNTFYEEWLEVGAIPDFRRSASWREFVRGSGLDDVGEERAFLRAAADELRELTAHFTWDADGSLHDLLLSDVSLTRSPELAGVYGVTPWDGRGEPPRLPAGQRAGLLTRAGLLISGTHETHPIHRGAIVRKRMLCDTLAAPDPNSLPPGSLVPPPPDPTQTTRERFAEKVRTEPCASCHAQMNPIGYVLERYDALGRHRDAERLIDESSGALVGTLPIDSSATPRITSEDAASMDDGVELSRAVAESGKVEACFARQYFRFTHRRDEGADDACALERVRTAVAGGTLREALRAIAESPSFKTRKVE